MWQYYRDKPASIDPDIIDNLPDKRTSFKFKQKRTGQNVNDGTNGKIMVPLIHLSNFCSTLEMVLINCEINLNLTCSTNCFIAAETTNNQ